MGLKGSVGARRWSDGRKAENFPNDVLCVRNLLNIHIKYNPDFVREKFRQLPTYGTNMDETIRAIKTFQIYALKDKSPTGRIDPGDKTLKELVLGNVPGKPTEPLAPIEDRIHNQLLRALHYDYWEFYDSDKGREGEIKSMIELLLYDPKVDDSYIRDRYLEGELKLKDKRLESYIKDADPDTIPPPINFTVSVRGLMKTADGSLKYESTDEVVRFLARVSDEIYVSYRQYWQYVGDTLYMEPSKYGEKAAATNVDNWFKRSFADLHSIYYCFPSIVGTESFHNQSIF